MKANNGKGNIKEERMKSKEQRIKELDEFMDFCSSRIRYPFLDKKEEEEIMAKYKEAKKEKKKLINEKRGEE